MKKILISTLFLAVAAASQLAAARSIYLNGVDISSVRGQTFKDVTVLVDEKGDVHLSSDRYKVEVVEPDTEVKEKKNPLDEGGTNPLLKNRYYLVTQPSTGGRAQYDFVVSINGVERKTIKADSEQVIMEISAWLAKGPNEIVVTARKKLDGGRKSASPDDKAALIIGTGHEEGKIVKVDVVHMSVKVNASGNADLEKRFTLDAI